LIVIYSSPRSCTMLILVSQLKRIYSNKETFTLDRLFLYLSGR